MKPKLNYSRLSGYTKSELWNYLHEMGFTEKTLGKFHDVSKARLRDILESTCVKCRKTFDNPLPKPEIGTAKQPICNECYRKRLKRIIEARSKQP